MRKIKHKKHDEDFLKALSKIGTLYDRKRQLSLTFANHRHRSNETVYEHIIAERHGLMLKDLDKLKGEILTNSVFMKDKTRKNTYNYLIPRTNEEREYIQISVSMKHNKAAEVKTMFITPESKLKKRY